MKRIASLAMVATFAVSALFGASQGENSAAGAAPATLTVVLSDRGNNNPDAPVYQEIERQLNLTLDLQLIPSNDFTQKKRTLIATDSVPDILQVAHADVLEFGDTGVFLALNDIIESRVPNFRRILDQNENVQKTAIDGTYYAFPTVKRFEFHRGIISVIRHDLLDQHGLPMPQSFDQLYDTLKALKAEYPEAAVWSNRNGGRHLINTTAYAYGTGADIYWDPDLDGGRYAYGPLSAQYRSLLQYLRRAYEDGILDPDFATLTASQWREKHASERSFFFYDNPTMGKRANDALVPVKPDAWWAPTPVLANSLGQRRSLFYYEEVWGQMWAVGAHTENQEAVARYFNWAYTDQASELKSLGIEGEHWVRAGNDYEFTETMRQRYTDENGKLLIDSFMEEVGTGAYTDFVQYIDMRLYRLNWPEYQINWYQDMEASGHWNDPKLDPPFANDERRRITDLRSELDTKVHAAIDKVILGDMSVRAWDDLVAEIRPLGEELESIYNAAEQRYQQSR